MLAVQPGAGDCAYEELRAVGARPSVGHGKNAGLGVLQRKVLVLKGWAVDGGAASAIPLLHVTPLAHEVGNDAVELGPLVAEEHPLGTHTSLPGTQAPEGRWDTARFERSWRAMVPSNPPYCTVVSNCSSSPEVLGCARDHIGEQGHCNAPESLAIDFYVEVDAGVVETISRAGHGARPGPPG